jgi:hypothetical protein
MLGTPFRLIATERRPLRAFHASGPRSVRVTRRYARETMRAESPRPEPGASNAVAASSLSAGQTPGGIRVCKTRRRDVMAFCLGRRGVSRMKTLATMVATEAADKAARHEAARTPAPSPDGFASGPKRPPRVLTAGSNAARRYLRANCAQIAKVTRACRSFVSGGWPPIRIATRSRDWIAAAVEASSPNRRGRRSLRR